MTIGTAPTTAINAVGDSCPACSRPTDLVERIDEAREHGWLGEVEGLQATLAAAEQKLAAMDAIAARKRPIDLGMPTPGPRTGTAVS
jgi:hypothetical protein